MSTINNTRFYIMLCVIALLSFIVGMQCHSNKKSVADSYLQGSDTLYVIDTTNHSNIKKYFNITNVYSVTPTGKIDTPGIIKNYYTKRFLADTLKDSLLQIVVLDTLFNNSVVWREKQYKFLTPRQTIITNTLSIPVIRYPNGFYLGSFFGFNKNLISAGVEADYVTKKINYGLGYDFKNNAVTGKLLVKISK